MIQLFLSVAALAETGAEQGAIGATAGEPQSGAPVSQSVYGAAQRASGWTTLSPADAQCTPGAKTAQHHAQVRIAAYGKNSSFTVEPLTAPTDGAVKNARRTHPNASYIGNGPIFMDGGQPNGYVKSGGKVLSPIDCVNFRTNPGNLGRQNSVFVKYHPRNPPPATGYQAVTKYRVVSTDYLCKQLQPAPFVAWLQSNHPNAEDYLKSEKKWEADGEDLVEGGEIEFAIQSGPGVLRQGQELLADYNSGTSYRSYIGVTSNGDPVVVEADGNIGSYCLGHYLKSRGITDLLHRDSFVSDASFRESSGEATGYPSSNANARAASLLVIDAR